MQTTICVFFNIFFEGLYVARHVLLHLDRQNEPMIRADIPETYKVPLGGNSSNHVMSTVQATKAWVNILPNARVHSF